MSLNRQRLVLRVYDIVFLILTLVLATLFIASTASVYFGGIDARAAAAEAAEADAIAKGLSPDERYQAIATAKASVQIYSRETVGARLISLLPAVLVWLAVTIGGIVLAWIFPKKHPKLPPPDDMVLRRLILRKPTAPRAGQEATFHTASAEIGSTERFNLRAGLLTAAVAAVALLFPFLYLADFSHFPNENLNGEVVRMALFSLPFVALFFGALIVFVLIHTRSMDRLKTAYQSAATAGDPASVPPKREPSKVPVRVVRAILFCACAGLIVYGCFNGSMKDVFIKAINICTECIGLG